MPKVSDTWYKGRRITESTNWWIIHSPNGYHYYCVHNKLLSEKCNSCEMSTQKDRI